MVIMKASHQTMSGKEGMHHHHNVITKKQGLCCNPLQKYLETRDLSVLVDVTGQKVRIVKKKKKQHTQSYEVTTVHY